MSEIRIEGKPVDYTGADHLYLVFVDDFGVV